MKPERSVYNFGPMTCYYRQGVARGHWEKSTKTIVNLHNISHGNGLQQTSTILLDKSPIGAVKALSTMLSGKIDKFLDSRMCLDGISDYLVCNSQVIELPRSGHFTSIEPKSQAALEKALEWAIKGEQGDIGAVISACYPDPLGAIFRVQTHGHLLQRYLCDGRERSAEKKSLSQLGQL